MSLKPLGNRLIIRPQAARTESVGGILIPETAGQAPAMTGTVISVGRGPASAHRVRQQTIADCVRLLNAVAERVPTSALCREAEDEFARLAVSDVTFSEVKEGDYVIFSPKVGHNIALGCDSYITLAEDDVEAVWQAEEVA